MGQPPDAREHLLRTDTAFAGASASKHELAARSLGLGVSAMGMPQFLAAEGDVRRTLGVPDNHVLVGVYGLGYPAVDGTPGVARPGTDLLVWERWNGGGSPRRRTARSIIYTGGERGRSVGQRPPNWDQRRIRRDEPGRTAAGRYLSNAAILSKVAR